MNMRQAKNGFTVVELLIVVVIIAILAAIIIIAFNGLQTKANTAAATSGVNAVIKKAIYYKGLNDTYPTSLAAIEIASNDKINYQFSGDGTTFCVTATAGNISMYGSDTVTTPVRGACSGHLLDGATPTTNYVKNPSFEGGSTNWTATNSNGYTGSVSTARAYSGPSSYAIVAPATIADTFLETQVPVTAPGTYTISGYVYLTGTGATFTNRDTIFGCASGACTGAITAQYNRTLLNQWQRITAQITATGAATLRVRFYGPASSTTYVDAAMVTVGSSNYADGSSPGWSWSGTPNNSISTGPAL